MKIALYHGYELGGSGSNEYTRYLAKTLADLGHDVVVICAEPEPQSLDFISHAVAYDAAGNPTELFRREVDLAGTVSLHQLPRTSVYPVFLTDKQRPGTVKAFPDMSDAEIDEYGRAMVAALRAALRAEKPDVVHANHLVYQPKVCAEACVEAGVPFYIVPHGSSIEYTVKRDPRFMGFAREGLEAAAGIAWIAREVRDRVLGLFDDMRQDLEAKSRMIGVGTDTSLFSVVPVDQREASLAELVSLHRPGGKTAAQRDELRRALDGGDIDATQRYWDAYNHKLEDDDFPALVDRIPARGNLLFFVGAMTYGKGIQTLIAALPGILARRPDTHLVLVGSGTYREVLEGLIYSLESGNETLFDQLVARGRDLERDATTGPLEDLAAYAAGAENRAILRDKGPLLGERVHLLGRLDHPRLRCIFPCARVAVFPSVIKEASPLVFAESLANGVLPTGSYHSGLRDGLDDLQPHLPGHLWERMKLGVEPETRVQSLIDNLSYLLDALDEHDMTAELRRLAEDRYDWTAIARKLAEHAARIAA